MSSSSSTPKHQTWIPSIAGWEKRNFKRFQEDCLYDSSGNMVSGSIGVHFNTNESLAEIFARFEHSAPYVFKYLTTVRAPDYTSQSTASRPAHLSRLGAYQLMRFYHETQRSIPYFYIRCGTETLYLCRRTSGYIYSPERYTATKGTSAPHRFTFEVVRPITASESAYLSTQVGRVDTNSACSMAGIPHTIYICPLLATDTPQDLNVLRSQLQSLRKEIASITETLDATLQTLRV